MAAGDTTCPVLMLTSSMGKASKSDGFYEFFSMFHHFDAFLFVTCYLALPCSA